jgi:hypothetical protein
MRTFVAVAVLTLGGSASSELFAAQPEAVPEMTAPAEDARLYLTAGPGPRRPVLANNIRIVRVVPKRKKRSCKGPDYDSRCIRVISDPAIVPPGVNVMVDSAGRKDRRNNRNAGDTDSREHYPACSKIDTDNCVQTYERLRGPQ